MPSYYSSPYSPSRANSRPRFITRIFKQIRALIDEIIKCLQDHPVRTLILVVIPLLLSGTLQKLLRKVGIRVPRWLQGKKHPTKVSNKQKKHEHTAPPSNSEAIKFAASVAPAGSSVCLYKTLCAPPRGSGRPSDTALLACSDESMSSTLPEEASSRSILGRETEHSGMHSANWGYGSSSGSSSGDSGDSGHESRRRRRSNHNADDYMNYRDGGQSFTPRSLCAGLIVGALIVFSNTYFGLQTGWVSTMAMPSALIGFAVFKTLSRSLSFPFTPVENVLVQTVAGAVGTMPLGCGFVGVIPALEFLLKGGPDGAGDGEGVSAPDDEGGPLKLSFWKLIVWSLGVCLFGVVFAVPLRKQVLIREKLKFPSGTASALMIRVLHAGSIKKVPSARELNSPGHERQRLLTENGFPQHDPESMSESELSEFRDWRRNIMILSGAFGVSAVYTLISFFIPRIRDLPILGFTLANDWLWTLNPSPAYIGQGIIMGTSTSLHMLVGAILGWVILSPMAKYNGWAPGPVNDWEDGSKGWIVWVSLAIMLADSIINLGWLVIRSIIISGPQLMRQARQEARRFSFQGGVPSLHHNGEVESTSSEVDEAPPEELISGRTIAVLLPLTLGLNVLSMHIAFGNIITPWLSTLATFLALILSVMGVRALGETDLNPVSGISKLTQLIFAAATSSSTHTRREAIVTNLLAGAVSESGALQAGDMLQDLKTGHLLGASPKAQFYGQVIGSLFGAFLATAVYRMYTSVYDLPGSLFQIPTAYVWLFTARLVTGQGLPEGAWGAAFIACLVAVAVTVLRIVGTGRNGGKDASWKAYVPGGVAVAVGMYNVPSFTLARAIGGVISWVFSRRANQMKRTRQISREFRDTTSLDGEELRAERKMDAEEDDKYSSTVVILASGLILGEGVVSILNLALSAALHKSDQS
ncbi:hypothetical protein KEM56_007571 [Ascosphaera pollenicola]|nr:hypothetical protein KEM56_007571 [Ascosphaera pollenicola]